MNHNTRNAASCFVVSRHFLPSIFLPALPLNIFPRTGRLRDPADEVSLVVGLPEADAAVGIAADESLRIERDRCREWLAIGQTNGFAFRSLSVPKSDGVIATGGPARMANSI